MRSGDIHILHALRMLGTQRTIAPIAERACVSPRRARAALERLEALGRVNIHRVVFGERKHIRWIVPVQIPWRGAHAPATTATEQAS